MTNSASSMGRGGSLASPETISCKPSSQRLVTVDERGSKVFVGKVANDQATAEAGDRRSPANHIR
jgi:hypothetical protein